MEMQLLLGSLDGLLTLTPGAPSPGFYSTHISIKGLYGYAFQVRYSVFLKQNVMYRRNYYSYSGPWV